MIWSLLLLLEMNSLDDKLPAEFRETEFPEFWLGGHCGQVSRGWLRWVKTEWAAEEQAPAPLPLALPFLVDAPVPLPLELPCLEEAMMFFFSFLVAHPETEKKVFIIVMSLIIFDA